jgi:hypothetical protein
MPFPLRFYGETFDSITICSNGFIAPGNQTRAITFQNYPMDLAMGGGAGMIAPYWDDLRLIFEQFGSVWYYYDQAENRLIVEWYKAVQISDTNQVTFEVIIYDTQARPTATDDCSILFQYKSIHTILGGGGDMPYASVGISSPDGKTGLSYCFRNVYPITSDTLRNRRAILYQTLPSLHSSGAEMELAPTQWEMIGSFPNPFNSNTTITYSLPTTKRTVIEVFDLRGRKVQTLLDALQPAGSHNVEFPAGGIPSGIYICRLQSGELTATRKLVLLR